MRKTDSGWLYGSTGRLAVVLLFASVSGLLPPPASAGEVELHYLGNEGFLVSSGETKVLVDALYGEGLAAYPVVPADVRRRAEAAEEEFAGVDVVVASHAHGDHFDAAAVAGYLGAEPGARFVSTEAAAAQVVERSPHLADRVVALEPAEAQRSIYDAGGVRLHALRLHHGATPVQNLGFLIEVDGVTLLHLGDTEAGADELRALRLASEGIDVALVPYWLFTSEERRSALDAIDARHVVAMHLPAEDATALYFEPARSLDELVEVVRAARPDAWIPRNALESRTFRGD